MNEQRINPRRRILKTGQIAFSDKAPKLECAVRNLSATGACLQVSTTHGMPAGFELIVEGARHACKIVWRTDTRLGVRFI